MIFLEFVLQPSFGSEPEGRELYMYRSIPVVRKWTSQQLGGA